MGRRRDSDGEEEELVPQLLQLTFQQRVALMDQRINAVYQRAQQRQRLTFVGRLIDTVDRLIDTVVSEEKKQRVGGGLESD